MGMIIGTRTMGDESVPPLSDRFHHIVWISFLFDLFRLGQIDGKVASC